MDFTTYTGLKSAIADYLNRDDLNVGGQIAGFIALTEAEIARNLRRSTATASLTFASGASAVALPDDVAELRAVIPAVSALLPRGGAPLVQTSFENLNSLRMIYPASGVPRVSAVLDGNLYVAPAPSDAALVVTISYFTKLVPLSVANPSNAVLIEAPDAYLYGACREAASLLEHDERIPTWEPRFLKAIADLNDKRQREEFGASLQKARLPACF